jgi:hypothetical protein
MGSPNTSISLEVEVEDLRDLDEQRRRHGAPVVLDEVQVGRGDPQSLGELHLAHRLLAAERADLRAEEG